MILKKLRWGTGMYPLMAFYIVILISISTLACFFSYREKRGEILSAVDMTLAQLMNEYQDITGGFWQIYIPIFEDWNTIDLVLRDYFTHEPTPDLNPVEKANLARVLFRMAIRDFRVQWIAVISDERKINYIFFPGQNFLQPLDNDFPYWEDLKEKHSRMEIYGIKELFAGGRNYRGMAICGGVPISMGDGKILVNYNIANLSRICKESNISLPLNFHIETNDQVIFDYTGIVDRTHLYTRSVVGARTSTRTYCTIPEWPLFLSSHANTPKVLALVFLFMIISTVAYLLFLKIIAKEVSIIRDGLNQFGRNNLDYRISFPFQQTGFEEIAATINAMAASLKENINRAYYYRLKQRDAELAELQAKFDPHFLYNSLEIFRARCYQNGDAETAELIAQLAAIFRGFLGSNLFIPIRDELVFSRRYLALFQARYAGKVQIRYDIDTEVLKYGIIRNVFQPLIENYFIHGFDTSQNDNYILFRGRICDKDSLIITVEDNGLGMAAEELWLLSEDLRNSKATERASYGLRNLHQRIKLFYGDDYGLSIKPNIDRGLSITMIITPLTMEEYEANHKINSLAVE